MLRLPGIAEDLPAMQVALQPTSYAKAWAGPYFTIRLVAELPAIRVHARGGEAAAARGALAGSGTIGRWFAIGDVILTREAYAARHALPGRFTHQNEWILPTGSVLNVGFAGPLFGHPGGALQAEWLSGPSLRPSPRPIRGFWASRAGHA